MIAPWNRKMLYTTLSMGDYYKVIKVLKRNDIEYGVKIKSSSTVQYSIYVARKDYEGAAFLIKGAEAKAAT